MASWNDNDWGGNIVESNSTMLVGVVVVTVLALMIFLFGFSVGWAVS